MAKPSDLIQGTLDLLILKTLSLGPQHGWGIAKRIRQVSNEALQITQGALYPALHRLEQQALGEIADASVSTHRFALFLLGLFSVLALVLASVGMYGVIAYSISLRMPEFGVRMALGARSSQLLRLILGEGLKLSFIGAAAGIVSGLALTRLMRSLLYEVAPSDPLTLITVPPIVLLTTAIACYIPARRATGADPMKALRAE